MLQLQGFRAVQCVGLFRNSRCASCFWFRRFPPGGSEGFETVLIVGSFFPCVYYGFYCDTHFQIIYLSIIAALGVGGSWDHAAPFLAFRINEAFGVGAAYIVLNPEYRKPSHRGARTKVFIALGSSGVIPVLHGLVSHGFTKLCVEMGFAWLVASGALYIAGALL